MYQRRHLPYRRATARATTAPSQPLSNMNNNKCITDDKLWLVGALLPLFTLVAENVKNHRAIHTQQTLLGSQTRGVWDAQETTKIESTGCVHRANVDPANLQTRRQGKTKQQPCSNKKNIVYSRCRTDIASSIRFSHASECTAVIVRVCVGLGRNGFLLFCYPRSSLSHVHLL